MLSFVKLRVIQNSGGIRRTQKAKIRNSTRPMQSFAFSRVKDCRNHMLPEPAYLCRMYLANPIRTLLAIIAMACALNACAPTAPTEQHFFYADDAMIGFHSRPGVWRPLITSTTYSTDARRVVLEDGRVQFDVTERGWLTRDTLYRLVLKIHDFREEPSSYRLEQFKGEIDYVLYRNDRSFYHAQPTHGEIDVISFDTTGGMNTLYGEFTAHFIPPFGSTNDSLISGWLECTWRDPW
jgi:hypothetical protein